MRSLVLCPYLPDAPDHGGKIRTRVLLAALARLGEVHVAAPAADGAPARLRLDGGTEAVVHALPAGARAPSPAGKLRAWTRGRSDVLARRWPAGCAARVRALLAQQPCTLVAVDATHAEPLLPRRAPPVLAHFHNVESALLMRRDGVVRGGTERVARFVEARLIARAEARLARRARLSITTSALDGARLLQLAPRATVEAVENSVELARLPQLSPPSLRPLRLLFVGSLDYPPNREAAEELLRVHLPVLRAAYADVAVRIVGRDDDGAIARLAAACGAEATGRVADLRPLYRDASAVYLPMRSGGGTRIKVIEACALGRPVVSTRVGVEGLDLRAGEHYLEIDTPQDGVRALAQLQQPDAQGAAGLIARARARAEERWDHARAIEAIARLVAARFG